MSLKLYDIITTLAARAFAMIGPFGVSIITARALGPEDRGRYFLILSFAQIAVQIASFGLQTSNTYLVARKPALVAPLIVNSLFISITITPLIALVIVLFFGLPELLGLSSVHEGSPGLTAFGAVPIAMLIAFSLFLTNLMVGAGKVQLFNGYNILYSVLCIGAAGIAATAGGGVLLFLFAVVVAVAVPCFIGLYLLIDGKPIKIAFRFSLLRAGVALAVKSYLSTMFAFLMMRAGIIALQQRTNFGELGQLSIALQLTDGMMMLPSTVGLLLFPLLIRSPADKRQQAMWSAFWSMFAVMSAILLVATFLLPYIIPLLFGEAYVRSVILTQMMLPPVLIMSLITVISQYLAADGYPKIQVVAWFVGFVVQAGLSYWLTAKLAASGVPISLAMSEFLVLVILILEVLRRRGRTSHQA